MQEKRNHSGVLGEPNPGSLDDRHRRTILHALAALVPMAAVGCAGGEVSSASDGVLPGSGSVPTTGSTGGATTAATPVASVTSGGTPAALSATPTSTPTASGPGSVSSSSPPTGNVINANPGNYLPLLRSLKPGDTLVLASGTYDNAGDPPGLPIFDLNGTAAQPITIMGPANGPRPLLIGRSTHNTIRLANASYIVIRNLEIDGKDLGGFGVATQGQTHHITIENLVIRGCGGDQGIVGISTTGAQTWNWTIRRNTIVGAGTGMYLGDSDGSDAFIAGLIENNVVRDTIGYNIQVKHQNPRVSVAGTPTGKSVTIIRHNVFGKSSNSSTGDMARPNVLVGHFPTSGPGVDDVYEIYGNFFYQNPSEALFQGEGNVAFYSNVMINDFGPGVMIQPHNDVPKMIRIFGNTIVAKTTGVSIRGGATGFTQRVIGNAVFAATPISGGEQVENVTDAYATAGSYLNSPVGPIGQLDLFPKVGPLKKTAVDASTLTAFTDHDRDFNGVQRGWTYRGAYAGEGSNAGWTLRLETKP